MKIEIKITKNNGEIETIEVNPSLISNNALNVLAGKYSKSRNNSDIERNAFYGGAMWMRKLLFKYLE